MQFISKSDRQFCKGPSAWLALSATLRSVSAYPLCASLDDFFRQKFDSNGKASFYGAARVSNWVLFVAFVASGFLLMNERVYSLSSDSPFSLALSDAGIDQAFVCMTLTVLTVGTGASPVHGEFSSVGSSGLAMVALFSVSFIAVSLFRAFQENQINETMKEQGKGSNPFLCYSWYACPEVNSDWRGKQVVVAIFTGSFVTIDAAENALNEVFQHESETALKKGIRFIIMSTQNPAEADLYKWDMLMKNPRWSNCAAFYCGNALSESDLEKALVFHAEQIFVVHGGTESTDHATCELLDDRVIVQTQFLRKNNPNLEIYAEIFCPTNRHRALEAGADHVLCVLGILYQVLGRSLSCPGIDQVLNCSSVYPAIFPSKYWGMDFIDAAAKAYEDYGVIPFALVQCFPDDDVPLPDPPVIRRVLLNPNRNLSCQCDRLVFCFAPSAKHMFDFISCCKEKIVVPAYSVDEREGKYEKISKVSFQGKAKGDMDDEPDYSGYKYIVPGDTNKPAVSKTKVKHGVNSILLSKSLTKQIPGTEHMAPSRKKRIPLKNRRRRRMTGIELMASFDPSRAWLAGSDITDHGQPLWSMWGEDTETSVEFTWQPLLNAVQSGFAQHTVICAGCNVNSVHYVVRALRSTDNSTWTPIIIVSESPPPSTVPRTTREEPLPAHLWPHVYWVKGKSRERKTLIRAGLPTCREVVILPDEGKTPQGSNHRGILELEYSVESSNISSVFFTMQEVRKLAPAVICSIASSKSQYHVNRTWCCPMDTIRTCMFRSLHNPFIIPLIGTLTNHSPPNLGERDVDVDEKDVPRTSQTLRAIKKLQNLESLLRESFLRRKGIPPYLFGKSFRHVMASFCDKFKSLPIALGRSDGSIVVCPGHQLIVQTGDFVLALVPMEYDRFVNEAMTVVRRAQSTEQLKERHRLIRTTNKLIGKQLVAIESMMERAEYKIRQSGARNEERKSNAIDDQELVNNAVMPAGSKLEGKWENEDTLKRTEDEIDDLKTLLNAIVGVRKTLREKQHVLKGIALQKSDSMDAAEVVFQQVTINNSLISILEEKCQALTVESPESDGEFVDEELAIEEVDSEFKVDNI
jgi:hypothetical protein